MHMADALVSPAVAGTMYAVSAAAAGYSIYKVKKEDDVSKIPVMMGFGIRTAGDVAGLKDTIDGCIVGTHFIELMEENGYNLDVAKEYIRTFKKELNS